MLTHNVQYILYEGMFPLAELVKRNLTEIALKNLGLIHEFIPWGHLIERAQTVEALMQLDSSKAYSRTKYIIEAITFHTHGTPSSSLPDITSIKFLPMLRKPDNFPLQWPGDESVLGYGSQMMLEGGL